VNLDSFWGLSSESPVFPVEGTAVARWETVELLDPERLGLSFQGPSRVVLPERRRLTSADPLLRGRLSDGQEVVLAARTDTGRVAVAFDPELAVAQLIARGRYTTGRPLTARLPFKYRRVPAPVRNLMRDLLTRRRAASLEEGYPLWPVEPAVELLRRVYLSLREAVEPGLSPVPFWPHGRRLAVALTHDVDSAEGLELAPEIAAEEAVRRHRSCWYLVGRDYPLDAAAIDELRSAGGELGLHGAHHDNRIAFLPEAEAAAQLEACRTDAEALDMRGFRSPSMLRTPTLYSVLEDRFTYDSSVPDTGLLPNRNGCATVFPFTHGRLVVLPLTLPPDGQLLGRGLDPSGVLAAWIAKTEWIASVGGVAVHLTHPERGFSAEEPMRDAYRSFMDWLGSREDVWLATPGEIVEHWKARGG
jgi:peptidoglycan/xylan/chitin deacetylase (PgdA/CDA1 family)